MSPQDAERRTALVPPIRYPEELPISASRDVIAEAITRHQVVVVAGETGSGKTTQLPKICLDIGRGVGGRIGHTQPRRIAARSVAERIAEELGVELGTTVGYQVRFNDHSSPDTLIKLMTDGILLTELQHDRMLSSYDTLIIDEAHERSLNIDFIIGYLKQLLPRRPDLKVVITSATIDPQRFSRHFTDADGVPAPVIEVSGRTYPIDVRYRPLVEESYDDDEGEPVVRDQTEAIVDAVDELAAEGPGDVLVFLPGEREIRDTADALVGGPRSTPGFEVVPLYARLSAAEQHRVFERHSGRRVVLATNVAETSLTVPGIRYVVDAGFARVSRYSARTKVQRLPIEPISRASANQRAGRCGRVAAGVCIRLYSEEDYQSRPEFTDPEILRTNLASVILQMTSLDLGEVARFPFVDPPDQRNVKAGVQLLEELGALSGSRSRHRLTRLGRRLAVLPVDPRLARMIVEADRRGVLREVLVIVSALSLQDPRERPVEHRARADQLHARFADKQSDFLTLLNLWRYLREQQRSSSSSAFRRMCRAEHLNYLRIREWQELESQLRRTSKQLKVSGGRPPPRSGQDEDAIHQSLLAGLLSHVGLRDPDRRDYLGARNARFSIFPGSGLFKSQPQFVMAAELVETSKLWGRVNAAIAPEWAEELGAHLVKRTYSEPHWSKRRAAVMAYERVTLYGVPLVADRLVSYGKVDPALARELFIRHALVYGEWHTRQRFFAQNRALLEEAEELEHRARRRDIVVDEHALFDFYDQRVGSDVVSGAHFDSWWKQARREDPDLLRFDASMLVTESAARVKEADYPDLWREGELSLPLSYQFDPGSAADGVSVQIDLAVLPQVSAADFSWQVPGLREELVVALIRSLPKALRTSFVPAPNHARSFLESVTPGDEPLLDALQRHLRATTGVVVPREAWDWAKVPAHLRATFRVVGESGEALGESKDLDDLKQALLPSVDEAIAEATGSGGRIVTGQVTWSFGTIERTFVSPRAGDEVQGYPALVDEPTPTGGGTVGLQVFGSPGEQQAAHRLGLRRLLLLTVGSPAKSVVDGLDNTDKLTLATSPYPSVRELVEDTVAAAVDALVDELGPAWDQTAFDQLVVAVRQRVADRTRSALHDATGALVAWREADRALSGSTDIAMLPARADMSAQAGRLVYRGFVADVGLRQLRELPRYFRAIMVRLEKLPASVGRDRLLMDQVAHLQQAYLNRVDALPPGRPPGSELVKVRWMLEELRVSLWAQQLGTAFPVSDTRVRRALEAA